MLSKVYDWLRSLPLGAQVGALMLVSLALATWLYAVHEAVAQQAEQHRTYTQAVKNIDVIADEFRARDAEKEARLRALEEERIREEAAAAERERILDTLRSRGVNTHGLEEE